jgi:hypothetical protein
VIVQFFWPDQLLIIIIITLQKYNTFLLGYESSSNFLDPLKNRQSFLWQNKKSSLVGLWVIRLGKSSFVGLWVIIQFLTLSKRIDHFIAIQNFLFDFFLGVLILLNCTQESVQKYYSKIHLSVSNDVTLRAPKFIFLHCKEVMIISIVRNCILKNLFDHYSVSKAS